jgi:hypothetical protein
MNSRLPTAPWRPQSAVTHVDQSGKAIDDLPSGLSELRKVSQQLVAHYMGNSDGSAGPVTGERLKEVDMRFAEKMFLRLMEMGPATLGRERPPEERIAGCCRDFATLFVTMARRKGFSARIRAGYATYFIPGWYVDHVIAEVWDDDAGRWLLLEPEVSDSFAARAGFDPLDVPPDKFVTGPRAWMAARSREIDPARFLVAPDLLEPYTRGWFSLRHHVVQDLAALNKAEMLVWDQWGILDEEDPLARADTLDLIAKEISDPSCPADRISTWGQREGLRVTQTVTSYSPAYPSPLKVDVTRVVEGMLNS